jgi:hypothetical protein
MASPRGQKRDLERARQERQARKRARRQSKGEAAPTDVEGDDEVVHDADYSEADVLAQLDELHRRHAAEEIGDDEFETARDDLLRRLQI